MSRAATYRKQYRDEVLAAARECERVLREAERAALVEYRRAWTALLRAGARYDRSLEGSSVVDRFEDLSLYQADPEQVRDMLDTATSTVTDELRGLREHLP